MSANRWLQENAEAICGGLRLTSTAGVVYVGDAALSPGVKNPFVYARLTELSFSLYKGLGVPLVNEAPGVELESDGLHWKVSSEIAVLNLVDLLVSKSARTSSFKECRPAGLWQWKYLQQYQLHYPYCKVCDTLASDIHLNSRGHLDKCSGNVKSFDFLQREQLCHNGLKFSLDDGSLDLRPVIEGDRPLLLDGCPIIFEDSRQSCFVNSFELLEELSSERLANTNLSKK